MKKGSKIEAFYLGIILVIMYLPIAVVMIYSFNQSRISSVWDGFSLKWYWELFKDKAIINALVNSIMLAAISSFLAAIIGTLAAVGMPRVKLPGKNVLEYISTLPIMIPEIILGMVFLTYFSLLKIPFGMLTLIIGHTAFCIPYVYIIVKARLVGLDESLLEAARDLGADEFRAFLDITMPLVFPAIASGMLLAFAMSFDDVIISIFITGVNVNTLPIKIFTQLKTGVTPKINALCTLMFTATVIICYFSFWLGKKNESTREE